MWTQPGGRLIIKGDHEGDPDWDGEIFKVHGSDVRLPTRERCHFPAPSSPGSGFKTAGGAGQAVRLREIGGGVVDSCRGLRL